MTGNIFRITAAAMTAGVILTGCGTKAKTEEYSPIENGTITVSAEESESVMPDKADIRITVSECASTADEAQESAEHKIHAIEKTAGKRKYDANTDDSLDLGILVYKKENLYYAERVFTITGININAVSDFINECSPDASSIEYVSCYYSGYADKYAELFKKAVNNAKEKADDAAKSTGEQIGSIKSIRETSKNNRDQIQVIVTDAEYDDGAVNDISISPDEITITAGVTAEYYVK